MTLAFTTPRRFNRRTMAVASPTMCRFSPALSVSALNSLLGSSMCTDRGMAEHVLVDAIFLGLFRGVIDRGNGGVHGNDVEPIAYQLRNHRQPDCMVKVRRRRVHIACLR